MISCTSLWNKHLLNDMQEIHGMKILLGFVFVEDFVILLHAFCAVG